MILKNKQLLRQQALIDGQWVSAESGKTIDVCDPATLEVLGTVPDMAAKDTGRAIGRQLGIRRMEKEDSR